MALVYRNKKAGQVYCGSTRAAVVYKGRQVIFGVPPEWEISPMLITDQKGDYVIPDGVTRVGSHFMRYRSNLLKNLYVPASVTEFHTSALWATRLGVTIHLAQKKNFFDKLPDYVQQYYDESQILYSQTIPSRPGLPDDIGYIEGTLTNVVVPAGVECIASYAFMGFENLQTVVIGPDVKSIMQSAFYYCPNLTRVIMLPRSRPSIHYGTFQGCRNLTDIYVAWDEPTDPVENLRYWRNFVEIDDPSWKFWGAINATLHHGYTGGING